MGDGQVNGPNEASINPDDLILWSWGRHIAQTPNGVLIAVVNATDFSDNSIESVRVLTSTDNGSTWSDENTVGNVTDNTQIDGKTVNNPMAVSGDNRVAFAIKRTETENTSVRIFDVNADGTLTNGTAHEISVSLDAVSGNMALTCDSTDEFWLIVHFSTATSTDYGFQIRRENPTDGSDPFNQVNAQFGQSNDGHFPDLQAGFNDRIHFSYEVQSTGTTAYGIYDPVDDVLDVHEDIGSNITGATTLAFNELDEPVIYNEGSEEVWHKNAGVWESTTLTTDTLTHGGVSSTFKNAGGDGDLCVAAEVAADNEVQAMYGGLDNDPTGSAIRDEDTLFTESDTISSLSVGYQFHHNAYNDVDEIDCLYVDENGAGDNRLMYFSAPTPLTISSSVESPTTTEPAISTQSPATVSTTVESSATTEPASTVTPTRTLSASVRDLTAAEPAITTLSPRTRNVSVESVGTVELGVQMVSGENNLVIAPSVEDLSAEEPSASVTPGAVTQQMSIGTLTAAEPSPSMLRPRTVAASAEGHATEEPDMSFDPLVLTPSTETLRAVEPSVQVIGGTPTVTQRFTVDGEFDTTAGVLGEFDTTVAVVGEYEIVKRITGEYTVKESVDGRFDTTVSVEGESET